ncbi:MAG: SDR family NAD(P)-dependent oxidoreductase, partial [Gammaproteobacteria bacterium]|nr:SDR family NAD(P)-dependent oxidoreductase [Gemmatimonadota bacterium]NIU78109.1 SDR family NAD(P)-dependent oxidoreductase [Gammaproteobacteria bacterium]NIV89436.1 SDR family NAD(P)-dependent oxidoreductase [Actinomycetota bacterium]NIX23728.1 SDR family NAD(P)-dependent oxidoreductase [Actinomycetota bacterium]
GSKGIGRGIAAALAGAGATVALCSRDEEEAETAAKEIEGSTDGARVLGVRCDVRDEGAVREMFERV